MVFGGFWKFLKAFEGFWKLLKVFKGFCRFLEMLPSRRARCEMLPGRRITDKIKNCDTTSNQLASTDGLYITRAHVGQEQSYSWPVKYFPISVSHRWSTEHAHMWRLALSMLTSKHVGLKSRTVCYAATHQQQSKPRSVARSIVRSIAPSIARSIAPSIARSIARSLARSSTQNKSKAWPPNRALDSLCARLLDSSNSSLLQVIQR